MLQQRDHVDVVQENWERLHPDLDVDHLGVSLRLIRTGRILDSLLEEIALQHGFKARGDFEVLATLRRSHPDPLQPAHLAERVMISTSGMTGRLDRLENAGLIERKPHPQDRRAVEIYITAEGVETADLVFAKRLETEGSTLAGLSSGERQQLATLLRKILTQLGDTP